MQNIRQSLLTAWKFSFENKIPGALQSSSSAPDGRLLDRFFNNMLPADRLRVCNSTEAAQKVEQVINFVIFPEEFVGRPVLSFLILLCSV